MALAVSNEQLEQNNYIYYIKDIVHTLKFLLD